MQLCWNSTSCTEPVHESVLQADARTVDDAMGPKINKYVDDLVDRIAAAFERRKQNDPLVLGYDVKRDDVETAASEYTVPFQKHDLLIFHGACANHALIYSFREKVLLHMLVEVLVDEAPMAFTG